MRSASGRAAEEASLNGFRGAPRAAPPPIGPAEEGARRLSGAAENREFVEPSAAFWVVLAGEDAVDVAQAGHENAKPRFDAASDAILHAEHS